MNTWTKEVPTKEGFYWFYGYPFGGKVDGDERLLVVEVWETKTDLWYVGLGVTLESDKVNGYWMKLSKPSTEGLEF